MGNNLKKLREKKGWTQEDAAGQFGLSTGGYIKIENGERDLKGKRIQQAADIYGVTIRDIVDLPQTCQLVGFVGAGAAANYYSIADSPFEEVPMPENGTPETVAVEIRGESLGALFDRWLVYYDDVRYPPTPDMMRKLCVVGLVDGRVLIKKLLRGSEPGLFHLLSATEGIIEDVEIEWAAKVKQMTPRD